MNDAARYEQPANGGERGNRIGEVLDAVVKRDDVEARLGQIQLLEAARGHAQAALATTLHKPSDVRVELEAWNQKGSLLMAQTFVPLEFAKYLFATDVPALRACPAANVSEQKVCRPTSSRPARSSR